MTLKKVGLAKKHGGKYSARARKLGVVALTGKQRAFIDEYMIDHNAAGAARRAGYAEATCKETGSRLKNTPAIHAELQRREYDRAERCDVKTDDILLELKRIAFFDVRTLFDPVTKKFRTDPWDMNEDELRALVNFDIIVVSKDGDYIVKAQPGNKIKALELLGRYKKLFTDKVETSGAQMVTFTTDFGTVPDREMPG
jgi:phage terminase small subunit